jgi:putative mRNA 3-end processing factor
MPPVTWRDGVHLTGTPIWCDARRRRDVCFVSSADRVGRTGHGQLIGTAITLAMLGARGAGHLAVPPRQRFTLGTLRLELIPTGRMLGGAALHVDLGGKSVIYAGAIRGDAEVRACDAVVVAAPLDYRARSMTEVAGELVAWTRAQLAAARTPVLAVDTALDGLELATRLAADDIAIAGSRAIRDAALRVGELAPLPAIRAPNRDPAAVIRVDTERLKLPGDLATALVSPRAASLSPQTDAGPRPIGASSRIDDARGDNRASAFDAHFAWPHTAGRDQLLAWIESTGARDVFVTGGAAEAIAAAVGGRARAIGPPQQMTLFPHKAAP